MTEATPRRYQKASKKQRGLIMNEFCALNGYLRSRAPFLLRNLGRTAHVTIRGIRTAYVFGHRGTEPNVTPCVSTTITS